MTNRFVDQIAKLEDFGGLSTSDAGTDTRFGRTPLFLYIKHEDYVCMDGFVYQYRQDIVNSFDWTYIADPSNLGHYSRQRGIYHTRNGWGALGDGFTTPVEFGTTWEIVRAFPNPQVEERRVLPEVNCTYWEPYRPYLRGDIVCRFEPDMLGGREARDYTITAYMCRIESIIPTVVDYQRDNLLQRVGVAVTNGSPPPKSENYFAFRADLCSGPVWETIYANPTLDDGIDVLNVVESVYADTLDNREDLTYDPSIDSIQRVVVQGVSNYWIAINAKPVLTTERQYTHYQSCVHPLLYASEDGDITARRRLGTLYDDYYKDDQDEYTSYHFLPNNVWEYISYASDADKANYKPSSGTATEDDASADTVDQKCFMASSDVYLMEQKSYTVVPNWDISCSSLDSKNFRIKYDISNPTDFPLKIQPFRNTFNGDDTLQLCAIGRVYACTSNRPCDIAFSRVSQDPSLDRSIEEDEVSTTAYFGGYGTQATHPWTDSTNLDLLGNT